MLLLVINLFNTELTMSADRNINHDKMWVIFYKGHAFYLLP